MVKQKPKILVLDIETRPALAYVWSLWNVNVSPDMLVSPGGTICVGAKWVGEKEKLFFADWLHGHKNMLRGIHKLLEEANAVVTYNGDKFDLPKLNGEFILNGLPPVAPVTSIDLIKTVRKFGFDMNRLGFIGPLLGLGQKMKHQGFNLWKKVMADDPKAQLEMQKYCLKDIVLTEALYKKVKPFIKNHPHLASSGEVCGACGGKHFHKRGFTTTKYYQTQRLQCTSCGSWRQGQRKKVS